MFYCALLLLLSLKGAQSNQSGFITLEPTFWEILSGALRPGYSRNGQSIALHGEVHYKPGSDCCDLFRDPTTYPTEDCIIPPTPTPQPSDCPIPDNCLKYCDRDACTTQPPPTPPHTCYYTRFGNGDCCEASRDKKAIAAHMITPSNCPCVLEDTCGTTTPCGRGLIGYLDNAEAFPVFKEIFPITNDVGVEAVVEIDVDGSITLKAWSLPVGYFSPGNNGGTYWYFSDANNPTDLSANFKSDPEGAVEKYTGNGQWQYVSLDGIAYVTKGSSKGQMVPKEWKIDVLHAPNQYEALMLVVLVAICGFCVGIGLYVANGCCKCTKNDKYSRVKVVDYNDTETE